MFEKRICPIMLFQCFEVLDNNAKSKEVVV